MPVRFLVQPLASLALNALQSNERSIYLANARQLTQSPNPETQLTNPPSDLKLKHVALGFGIQNYTCSAVGSPSNATGALAMLYDVLPYYPGQGLHSLSKEDFAALPGKVLAGNQKVPLNFDPSTDGRADPAHLGATATDPFTADAPLQVEGMGEPMRFLGHHFFNDEGVPTFVLDGGAITLLSKKDEGIPAPADADAGPDGTGAVAWLKLSDKGGSQGATLVYRVLTAGGNSHGCGKGVGGDSTSYTATYWFYG